MAKKSAVIYATHARHKDNFNVYFSGGSLFSGNTTVVAITKEIAKSTENTRALLEHRTMCGKKRDEYREHRKKKWTATVFERIEARDDEYEELRENEAIANSKQRTRVLRWQLAARIDALSTEDAARAEDHGAEATTYHDIPDFTDEELAVDDDITDQLD